MEITRIENRHNHIVLEFLTTFTHLNLFKGVFVWNFYRELNFWIEWQFWRNYANFLIKKICILTMVITASESFIRFDDKAVWMNKLLIVIAYHKGKFIWNEHVIDWPASNRFWIMNYFYKKNGNENQSKPSTSVMRPKCIVDTMFIFLPLNFFLIKIIKRSIRIGYSHFDCLASHCDEHCTLNW